MNNLNYYTMTLDEIAERVENIASTECTKTISQANRALCNPHIYTSYGLQTLGSIVGFPAKFIDELSQTNFSLASEVMLDRMCNYFSKDNKPFCTREFLGKICGVVSQNYAYFDDSEVISVIEQSTLKDMRYHGYVITPERFHVRAVDYDHPFRLDNDDSDLYICFFIDNSMVGQSSFRIQMGVFRLACTNGMIVPVGELTLCKQVHRGRKDIYAEFAKSIECLSEKTDTIKSLLTGLSREKATIEDIKEELRGDFIAKKLNLNQKESKNVMRLYNEVYDGKTKWDFVNAVTEFARDLNDINRREWLERMAYRAA